MPTDRKKICKCGIHVADLLGDITTLDKNMKEVDIEKLPTYMESFKLSINSIYRGVRNVEESCGIDAADQWHTTLLTDDKIDELRTIKDSIGFGEKKIAIFGDLSQIKYQITEKVRRCSNQ